MTPDHEWTKVPACLEDAFIHLMQAK
jgi:hypothetical protein